MSPKPKYNQTDYLDPARDAFLLNNERNNPLHGNEMYSARKGFPEGTPIRKEEEDRPSVLGKFYGIAKGLSTYVASSNPLSSKNRFLRARDAAHDEFKKWLTKHKHASHDEKTAKFAEYNAEVQELRRKYGDLKGGKKRSRKYRKNRKTRSRKNRKTRSRK